MLCLRKHRINTALSRNPFAENEPFVECARIKPFIAADYRRSQRGIVFHREMEIETVFFIAFFNPFLVKPMHRMLRIAVEPQL